MNINFMGDVMLGELIENYMKGLFTLIETKGIDPFKYAQPYLPLDEINILNLECVISDHTNRPKPYSEILRVPEKYVNILVRNNISIVNLANNHSLDHGTKAFEDMVDILNRNNIKYFGYYKDTKFQLKPLLISTNAGKVGIFGYNIANLSDNQLNIYFNKILEVIIKYKGVLDIIILSLHWANEYTNIPAPKFIQLGKKLIHAGVDILYGHHSHRLQGIINFQGGIFAPSLGNFIFSDTWKKNKLTAILKVTIDDTKQKKNYEIIPFYGNKYFQPVPQPNSTKKIKRLSRTLENLKCNRIYELKIRSGIRFDRFIYRLRMRFLFILNYKNYGSHFFDMIKGSTRKKEHFSTTLDLSDSQ